MAQTTAPPVATIVEELRGLGSDKYRAGMARYGIETRRAFGVSIAAPRPVARRLKRVHALALALWQTGYTKPACSQCSSTNRRKSRRDRWISGRANSIPGISATKPARSLFVKTPFAEEKVRQWAEDEHTFVRRAGFALLAAYAVHGKSVPDARLADFLPLIERHSDDPRNFVKKAVNWALRQIGKRSIALHSQALAVAERLSMADGKTARWIGKDAVRELADPAQIARIKAKN